MLRSIILVVLVFTISAAVPPAEVKMLCEFFFETNSPSLPWLNTDGWSTCLKNGTATSDPCDGDGWYNNFEPMCDSGKKHIIHVNQLDNQLSGVIPTSFCSLIPQLSKGCELGENTFDCPLPCNTSSVCSAKCAKLIVA